MAVYDCFTFYNELELLELRLKVMNDVVDYFVIVELDVTHRNEPKPFILADNFDRYKEYKDKIIHLKESCIIDYDPTMQYEIDGHQEGDRSIENYQRNCIMHGLNHCRPDDIIIVSDLDEIPNPDILRNLDKTMVSSLGQKGVSWGCKLQATARMFALKPKTFYKTRSVAEMLEFTPVSIEHDWYLYFMNCYTPKKFYGSVISKYEKMAMPQAMRDWRYRIPFIKNGGWHFSYTGGIDIIKKKLGSIVDGNSNLVDNDAWIKECLGQGKWLYGKENLDLRFVSKENIGLQYLDWFIEKYPAFYRVK